MNIYLDFDGTVVEHDYPKIGRCNFGCIEVIKKLQDSGHTIILNTMRVEFNNGTLEGALEVINEKYWMMLKKRSDFENFKLQPIFSTTKKLHPWSWNLNQAILGNELYIDDIASGIPLKPCCTILGNMVDWDEVEKQLKEKGIIK